MHPLAHSDRVDDGDVLAQRIETLAAWISDVEKRVTTTELTTADEGTARELRRAIEALASHDPDLEERITDRVEVVRERLETLAGTVSATTAALAGRDGEIAALRRRLEVSTARDEEVAGLRDAIELATNRIEKVVAGHAERNAQLEALTRRFEASQQHVDALVGELRSALESERARAARPPAGTAAAELARLRAEVDGLRSRLESAEHGLAALSGSSQAMSRAGRLEPASTAYPEVIASGARIVPLRGVDV